MPAPKVMMPPMIPKDSGVKYMFDWFDYFLHTDRIDYPCTVGAGEYAHPTMRNRYYTCMAVKGVPIPQSQGSCPWAMCYNPNLASKCGPCMMGDQNYIRMSDKRPCNQVKGEMPQAHPWDPTRYYMCKPGMKAAEQGSLYHFHAENRCPYGTCFTGGAMPNPCGDAAMFCPPLKKAPACVSPIVPPTIKESAAPPPATMPPPPAPAPTAVPPPPVTADAN